MKATLEFNLPEEKEEFKRMSKADDLCHILYEYKEWLRNQLDDKKEGHPFELAWKRLWELMEENAVNLDELWI